MHGIRIQSEFRETSPGSRRPAAVPAGMSAFAFFFAPILPELASAYWLYESFPFRTWADDSDYMRLVDTVPGEHGCITPDTFLPRYARFVADDWASLFGFSRAPSSAEFLSHFVANPRDYTFISERVDLCFFNVDGAWWEFYSQQQEPLDLVAEYASTLSDVRVEAWTLAQRDTLYIR